MFSEFELFMSMGNGVKHLQGDDRMRSRLIDLQQLTFRISVFALTVLVVGRSTWLTVGSGAAGDTYMAANYVNNDGGHDPDDTNTNDSQLPARPTRMPTTNALTPKHEPQPCNDTCPVNNESDDGEGTSNDGCDPGGGSGGSPVQGRVAATGVTDTGVHLKHGSLWAAVRDSGNSLRGPDLRSGNMYTSDPKGQEALTNMNGYGWFGVYNPFLRKIDSTTFHVYLNNSVAMVFTGSGTTKSTAGENRATLEDITADKEFRLTFHDTGARLFFDNKKSVWDDIPDYALVRQETQYGNDASYTWDDDTHTKPRMIQVIIENEDTGSSITITSPAATTPGRSRVCRSAPEGRPRPSSGASSTPMTMPAMVITQPTSGRKGISSSARPRPG